MSKSIQDSGTKFSYLGAFRKTFPGKNDSQVVIVPNGVFYYHNITSGFHSGPGKEFVRFKKLESITNLPQTILLVKEGGSSVSILKSDLNNPDDVYGAITLAHTNFWTT